MFYVRDYLYKISIRRKAYFTELCINEGLTMMEVEVMLFLHTNPQSNSLSEIIHAKDYTKSHVSSSIAKLEDDGYLTKHTSEKNKKVLKLELLPKSRPLIDKILRCLETFHKDALRGISTEQIEEMNKLLAKVCDNLKENS